MMIRPVIAAALLCLPIVASCDRRVPHSPTKATTRASASRPAEALRRIPLVAIPFTAIVPEGWDVRAGPGGQLALNGPAAEGGDVDVLLSTLRPTRADSLPATLAKWAPTTARAAAEVDAGLLTRRIVDRDGLTIVDEAERLGTPDQPADLAPFRWTIRLLVIGGGLSYPTYELNVAPLTQVGYERNQTLVRAIVDSIRYDASAGPTSP